MERKPGACADSRHIGFRAAAFVPGSYFAFEGFLPAVLSKESILSCSSLFRFCKSRMIALETRQLPILALCEHPPHKDADDKAGNEPESFFNGAP